MAGLWAFQFQDRTFDFQDRTFDRHQRRAAEAQDQGEKAAGVCLHVPNSSKMSFSGRGVYQLMTPKISGN
jgi:hypothetical protein